MNPVLLSSATLGASRVAWTAEYSPGEAVRAFVLTGRDALVTDTCAFPKIVMSGAKKFKEQVAASALALTAVAHIDREVLQ